MTVRGNVTWRALRHRLGHALRPFDAAQDMLCASHLFSEPVWLSVHPPIDVDLVALVLRDVEGVSVGIEATVLGHRPAARSLTDAALGQRIQEMLDIGHQPTEVVEAVPRTFPFVHIAARAIRQNGHRGLPVRRPAHHPALRADFFTRGGLAKAKDVDIEVEHVVVVGDTYGDVANARKLTLDLWRVELMSGKAYDLAIGIGHAVVAVEKIALFLANVALGREIFEPIFDLTDIVDGDPEVIDAQLAGTVPGLEYRNIVKAVCERNVSLIGAAELAHLEVGGVKMSQSVWMFAYNGKIPNL